MFAYLFLFMGLSAHAQFDPSTALLLRAPADSSPEVADDLDPEIYRVVPTPQHARRPTPTKAPTGNAVTPSVSPSPAPVATWTPGPTRAPAAAGVREDRIAVRVSGGYFGFTSTSRSSSRAYTVTAPAVSLGLDFWMTKAFGLRGEYWSSVAAAAHDRVLNSGVSVDVEQIDLGLTYRSSRDFHAVTTDFDWALGYHETSADFAHSARGLIGHRTRGLDLSFAAARAATITYTHQAEAHVTALILHDQLGMRMDEGRASTRRLTPGASLGFGGRYRFESGTHSFWRLEHSWERNLFDAARIDSHLTVLRFGLEWGT